jgi:glycosyltransferase involved in cell wall biosynthesis
MAAAQRITARLTFPLLPVDVFYPWTFAAASRGVSMVGRHGIDLIWSTGPPLSVHELTRKIAQRTGTPYVTDFRDVRILDLEAPLSFRDRTWAKVEQRVLQGAAGITYVSAPGGDVLHRRFPSFPNKRHELIHNWFDQEEINSCPPARFGKPTILSAGRLYSTRPIDRFFKGLIFLKEQATTAENANIQFVHYGGNPRVTSYVSQLGRDMGLDGTVRCEPAAPRAEFLSACKGADLLLLLVGHDGSADFMHHGSIPGKLYNYFAAGKPILVVGPRGCEAGKMVERVHRGIAVPDDEPGSIAEGIERLLGWRAPAVPLDLSPQAVREFETVAAVEKMAGFLDSLISRTAESTYEQTVAKE